MSGEPENFEQLRRLLAVKRYEQPPPGYFNHFSGEVIARIRAGETGGRTWGERLGNYSWVGKLSGLLEIRPALAGVFGVAVCGFLVMAGIYTEPVGNSPDNGLFAGTGVTVVPAEPSVQLGSVQLGGGRLSPLNGSLSGVGTRGMAVESPFLDAPRIQPVMYNNSR